MQDNETIDTCNAVDEKKEFVPLFDADIKDESDTKNEDATSPSEKKLQRLEEREAVIKKALESLEKAFELLKQRQMELNAKEEALRHEYELLIEIESIYQKTESITETFGKELPNLTQSVQSVSNNGFSNGEINQNERIEL